MRKTKIICTLGPSTDKDGVLRELVANGMNVARCYSMAIIIFIYLTKNKLELCYTN